MPTGPEAGDYQPLGRSRRLDKTEATGRGEELATQLLALKNQRDALQRQFIADAPAQALSPETHRALNELDLLEAELAMYQLDYDEYHWQLDHLDVAYDNEDSSDITRRQQFLERLRSSLF